MKKCDIVDYVINATDLTKAQATNAVNAVFDAMCDALIKGENVYVRGFATIKHKTTKPRVARNINQGTAMHVPEQKTAKLILGGELKTKMNE